MNCPYKQIKKAAEGHARGRLAVASLIYDSNWVHHKGINTILIYNCDDVEYKFATKHMPRKRRSRISCVNSRLCCYEAVMPSELIPVRFIFSFL